MNFLQPFETLRGRVCVLTGGAGHIGKAFARGLAEVGVHVALIGRDAEKAQAVAMELETQYGVGALGLGSDVTSREKMDAACEVILAKWGKVDYLVNCAGGNMTNATAPQSMILDPSSLEGTFFDFTEEALSQVMALNFVGTLVPTQVFAAGMVARGEGSVINLSSVSAALPLTRVGGYSAAKAAIDNVTKWLAVHFAKTGVRVNAIAPGFFLTDQNRFLLLDQDTGELTARGQSILSQTPMGRFGELDELVGTLLYLLSPLSGFVTGSIAAVDGGFTAFGRV